MRYRTKIDETSEKSWFGYFKESGSDLYRISYSDVNYKEFAGMADVVTPNFHKLQKQGAIINSPMWKQSYVMYSDPMTMFRTGIRPGQPNVPIEQYHEFWGNDSVAEPGKWFTDGSIVNDYFSEFQSERDIAITQAWASVDEAKIQALASLGELPETVKWIMSIYQRSIEIGKMFKSKQVRANVKHSARFEKTDLVSNSWLEFRYAFRPLVFEMDQAVAALKAELARHTRQTARGWNEVLEQNASTEVVGNPADVTWTETNTVTFARNYRAGVLYDVDVDTLLGAAGVWGLDQPLESIWELIPFSFIIDWFFNVGDVLSSWSIAPGLTPLSSWITEEHVLAEECRYYNLVNHNAATVEWLEGSFDPGVTTAVHTWKRRLPSPTRSVLPHVKINLDWAKLLDLAFIARSIIKSVFKLR